MNALLLVASVGATLVAGTHGEDTCESIRQVRRLAQLDGLDDATLTALESRYCGRRVRTEACVTLDMMHRLAMMDRAPPASVHEIAGARRVACATGSTWRDARWSNAVTVRSATGTWRYPNGSVALSTTGIWSYPNGVTARSSTGMWRYPNGVVARSHTGAWYDPRGIRVSLEELLTQGCAKRACQAELAAWADLEEQERIVRTIEWAWTARE